ncbi:MAG: phage tail tape measure protein [Muribaculaceae bacterium]|nr:phage tail tape measure protein [Muribaculaceae bacterium]
MSDYTTNASVNLTMNGEQPKKVLEELRTRAFNLENAIAKAAKAGNKTELTKLRKELKTTQRQIREMESATMQVEKVLKQLDKATPKELQRTLKTLEKQLNNLERGSEAWKKQTEYIKQVRAEIDKVNRELRNGESFWERFNRKMNDWQTTLAAGAAAVTGIVMAGRSAVNAFAEMDAEMANVRKFTGMTAEQVELLNQEFKKIDTRTSREDLNKLAQEAGRLGKTSQEDVLGFVKAADQINVALDDLGDGATLTLSKLTNIFGDEARLGTERSLLAVGSVINELSQNCTASAPYLAQFSQRLAGVGAQAGMTIPQLMAFAAVLDSQGQAVEMSATAMSKLIMDLFKETDKIAKATGLDLEEFKATLDKSTNEGLLMLLDRLKQLGGMDVLAPVFKDMGEEGARASAVISALAGNVDTVRRQQVEANKAFNEATSVTKEFNVQNTTVQAGLDKARKRLTELAVELGEKLAPVMKHVISSTTLLLKMMSAVIDFVAKYKGEIVVVTASIVAYTIAVNAAAIKTKVLAVAQGIAKVATVAWTVVTQAAAVVTALFTGKLHKAKIEFMLFSAMLKASPIGLLVAGITAVVGGLVLWISRTKELTIAQKQLNDIENKAKQDTAEELSMLKVLYEASQDQKRSIEERTNAIAQLQEKYPDYFGSLSTEAILAGNAASEYDRLTTSILNSARAKARQQQMVANEQEILKLEQERDAKVNAALDDMSLNSQDQRFYGNSRQAKLMVLDDMSLEGKPEYLITKRYIDQVRENYNGKISQYRSANNSLSQQVADDVVKSGGSGNTTAKCPKCGKLPCVCFKGGNGGNGDGDNSPENSDRFKVENEWKEREEALNRIAYAKGEKSYEEYNKRINEIAVEYYKKLKGHKEATALEQVQFEAQYYEALKKQADDNTQLTLDKERESYNERLADAKQFFIDGKYSLETYNEAVARIEEEHLRNMVTLTKEGTKERMDAEKALADFQYNMAVKKQQETKKQQEAIQKSQEQLKKDYFGDNAVERKNAYESDLANLQIVYEAELKATEGNAQEKLRIDEAYEKAKLALKKKYGLLAEEDNRNALERMNADFAEWLESDGGKAVMQSFDTIMSGMGAIFSQVSSLVQAELEIQTAAINKRYDKEISLAEGNSYKIAQLEKQKEKEIAKAKNEANKKMFAMQVIQAVAQTATNAINAYGSAAAIPVVGFVMAPIAAAMAVAAGALQIAAIKKQQQASEAQGYAKGGFTPAGAVDEEVGVVHAGEWVASQKLLANPVARPLINALDYAQRTNTIGSLRSADVSRSLANQSVVAQSAPTIVVEQNTEYTSIMKKLAERLDEPFVTVNTITGDNGIKKAQDEYDKLMRNKTPKSKRK